MFGQTSVATAESATGATASYVGNPVWNAVSNTNNGVAFVVSAANQYVSNALSYSTRYYIEGFSKIAPEIRFQTPVGDFYTTFQAVQKVAAVTKYLGKFTGAVGIGMTVYELGTDQKEWVGEGGLDLIMGVVGFCGPYGWLISGAYFGGKMILEVTDNKFW